MTTIRSMLAGAVTLIAFCDLLADALAQTSPTQTSPTQTSPTQTSPTQTSPTQASPAQTLLAQTPPASPPTRLRGSIAAIDGKTATIATREGASVPVKLADNWAVMLVSPMTMADIKENSFVGIASLKGPDGTLNALEVLVFPEAARGSNEGHYPWDLQPESMMTNATVATVAAAPDGQTLTLKYKDGVQTIKVKPGTPIVTFAPGDRADAKVGAKVFFGATKGADGGLTAGRLLVGKDGLTPPM